METQLIDGASYDLGSCFGVYCQKDDTFDIGNHTVGRFESIYADNAGLYLRSLRESEIARNAREHARH